MIREDVQLIFRDICNREPTETEILTNIHSNISKIRLRRILTRCQIKNNTIVERKKDRPKVKHTHHNNHNNHNKISHSEEVIIINRINNKNWKDFCRDNLSKIRKFFFLEPLEESNNQAVLSVFEESDCFEFVLRNMLVKLLGDWGVNVVCPTKLVDYVNNIIKDISSFIQVIPVEHEKYNKNMLNKNFWQNLKGDKILCMTPDTILFDENYDDFLQYDYIGAPWKYKLKGTYVGDGKLSIRSRKIMLDILENFTPQTFLSEDVFFSSTMLKHNIGKLANTEEASKFSYKDTRADKTFGGSMIWRSNDGVVDENELLEKVL